MVRITASEARRRWFEILDRVIAGQPVVIERKGLRIVLRREDPGTGDVPDYATIIRVPAGADLADRWSWEWEEGRLRPVTRSR